MSDQYVEFYKLANEINKVDKSKMVTFSPSESIMMVFDGMAGDKSLTRTRMLELAMLRCLGDFGYHVDVPSQDDLDIREPVI